MKTLRPGQPILTVKNLKRKFGDRLILKDVSFSLQPGDSVFREASEFPGYDLVARDIEERGLLRASYWSRTPGFPWLLAGVADHHPPP